MKLALAAVTLGTQIVMSPAITNVHMLERLGNVHPSGFAPITANGLPRTLIYTVTKN